MKVWWLVVFPSVWATWTETPMVPHPFLWTQEERLNHEKAKVITGSFPFIIIRLLLGRSATLLICTLLIWPCSPRLTRGQKASSVCTFSARASSSVPSAVSVLEVSVCKDLTLSFRPLSCFSLSFSWSWRFSIYIKKTAHIKWPEMVWHCIVSIESQQLPIRRRDG